MMETQMVVFELATEQYGVDISAIDGIIKMQAITRMPHAPAFLEGITNLRGTVVPVIDLRRRFGLEQREETNETRIIVAMLGEQKVGMVVDAVSQVQHVSDESIEPPPPMSTTSDSAFIKGIAKIDGQLIILLDLDRVLSDNERESIASMPTEG
jgi:purine-binding chemotaxis protein CheW